MVEQTIYGLGYVEHLSYLGTYLAVALSGYALPVPEELILVLGGFLSAQGITNFYIICLVGFLGAITGDNMIYYLSGHGSKFAHKYKKKIEGTSAGWYIRQLRTHTWRTVFFSRFIVGMRFLNPLVSGLMEIPPRTFITASVLSAVIYVPLVVGLGFYFHEQIHILVHIIHSIRRIIVLLLALGSVVLIFTFFRKLVEKPQ